METFTKGIYQHYKGKRYEVIGVALHSETGEELVIYKMLYQTEKHAFGTLWARPKKMFIEKIEVEGKWTSRFQKIENT